MSSTTTISINRALRLAGAALHHSVSRAGDCECGPGCTCADCSCGCGD